MDAAQVKALASELEATLGLLTDLLAELRDHRSEWSRSGRVVELVNQLAARPNLAALPAVMVRVQSDMADILGGIRHTREAIEAHTVERIRETNNRVKDVTATTESATLELLNGLDRSQEIINTLERQTIGGADSAEAFQSLRGQLSALYGHLQFQDITSQQLQGVTHSLLELETRIAAVGNLFDHALVEDARGSRASSVRLSFNPDATLNRAATDQASVDQAFKGGQHGATGSAGSALGADRG